MLESLDNKITVSDFGQYIIYTSSFHLSETFLCLLPKDGSSISMDTTEFATNEVVYFSKKTSSEDLYIEYKAIIEYLIKSDGEFIESDYFKHMKLVQEKLISSKSSSKKASSQALTYAELNDFKGVMDMLSEGADINFSKIIIGSFKGYSLLDFAIHHGHTDIVSELLNLGAFKTCESAWSKSYIIRSDTSQIIKEIIDSTNVLNHDLDTILKVSYQNRDYETIESLIGLIDHTYDADMLNVILATTIQSNKLSITTMLLEHGLLPSKKDICLAIQEGMMGFISELLDPNSIGYPVNADPELMMSAASSVRGVEMVNILLKTGDYGSTLINKGTSALSISAKSGRPETFSLLVQTFVDDLDFEDKNGFTPLSIAIRRNYPDMVKRILLAKPNINYVNVRGETPLFAAAIHSTKEVMLILLSEGADPNQKNNKGTTPLMSLALTKEIEAIKTLLDNKGDPEVVNNNGLNTLAASLVQKYDVPSIVELILEYGCDTNSIVVINDRELNMKELAERKNKHQSLIVLNRPEFNKE
jgi:ankyrin repeat protein